MLTGVRSSRHTPLSRSDISAADRRAIVEILKETKPGLAASWKPVNPIAAN